MCRANPVWLDPFCRNLELATQAEHEDNLPEDLSDITDLWNSPARTHVSNKHLFLTNSLINHSFFLVLNRINSIIYCNDILSFKKKKKKKSSIAHQQ